MLSFCRECLFGNCAGQVGCGVVLNEASDVCLDEGHYPRSDTLGLQLGAWAYR